MWPNLQETADLVTFTEEILNGKLHFFVNCFFVSAVSRICACSCFKITNQTYIDWTFTKARPLKVLFVIFDVLIFPTFTWLLLQIPLFKEFIIFLIKFYYVLKLQDLSTPDSKMEALSEETISTWEFPF